MISKPLLKAIAVTVELTGTQLSEPAKEVLVLELAQYPEFTVIKALVRCRRELKGRLSLAAILDRMEGMHPGVEEAWAMVPHDEQGTVVWTQEIAAAYGVAAPLLDRDGVQARMAFKEVYEARVGSARAEGRLMPKWIVSLGHDRDGRLGAIAEAVAKGRLTRQRAVALLPEFAEHQAEHTTLPVLARTGFSTVTGDPVKRT